MSEAKVVDPSAQVAVTSMPISEKGAVVSASSDTDGHSVSSSNGRIDVPLRWKIGSVIMVCFIGFGSAWSANLTSAMKSTIKRELKINNTQFALLEASEDFMATVLMLLSGIVTDKIGGASAMLYGNLIYTAGTIFVAGAAQGKSYQLMIVGRVIVALGDICTQIAQYKIFSSWFPPSAGFAFTLGLELGVGRIGGFVGTSTANIIAKKTGNFANVFWVSVGINIFTNLMTILFYFFTKTANKKFNSSPDPATGERLTESNRKLEFRKVLELPWTFWAVLAFSLVQTSTASVFQQNATELAEQRFKISSITAGWYAAMTQYAGFFLTPILGAFIDVYGNRISCMLFCGCSMLTAMALVNWGTTTASIAAGFGVYGIAGRFGPTTIIDSIRTSMWHQDVFGSAYAVKVTMNNAMNIIVRVITGAIQDADNNSYDRVTVVYVFLAAASVVVSTTMIIASFVAADLKILQYTRKQRMANGGVINARKELFHGINGPRNRLVSRSFFMVLIALVLGSWTAYFWGVATGNNA